MTKVIQCPCGYSIREAEEGALVASAQRHAQTAHGIELTREQALAMAKPASSVRRVTSGEGSQM